MAELKTKKTSASVSTFLASVEPEERRRDSEALLSVFKEATGLKPAMWGESIIGFGSYHHGSVKDMKKRYHTV